MTTGAPRARGTGRAAALAGTERWLRNAWVGLFVLAAAMLAGTQIASPDRRILQVIAAGGLVAVALRVSSFTSLLFLVVAVPFPKPTSYGGTTVAFVLLIFILWMARLTFHIEKPAGRSGLDLPVVLLISAYLLAFAQFESEKQIGPGVVNFFYTLTHIFLCFLIIHLTRTEKQLRQLIGAIVLMAVLVQMTAVYELIFPARALVPGWIELGYGTRLDYLRHGLEIVGMRVGGAFQDYELLAEFTAMIAILLWFLFVRARGAWARAGVLALLLLDTFVLLATVTRGALVSLAVAAPFLLWKARRHLRFHSLVIVLALVLGGGWLVLDLVAHHTRSGNVMERMESTTFIGALPENRAAVWQGAWERILKRPIFGYGPYYETTTMTEERRDIKRVYWPHDVYLMYWHMLGIIGLAAFLWILRRLWRATRGATDSLSHSSYAGSLLLALQGMLLLFIVDEIKIDYVRNNNYSCWVWMFFGLIMATSRIAAEGKDAAAVGTPLPEPAARRGPRRPLDAVSSVTAV